MGPTFPLGNSNLRQKYTKHLTSIAFTDKFIRAVGEQLPMWRVTLHLYVRQYVEVWGNGCTRYFLTRVGEHQSFGWGTPANNLITFISCGKMSWKHRTAGTCGSRLWMAVSGIALVRHLFRAFSVMSFQLLRWYLSFCDAILASVMLFQFLWRIMVGRWRQFPDVKGVERNVYPIG